MGKMDLKQARLKEGLSVSEFAKKYGGFSCATVRRWESGGELSRKSFIRIFLSLPIENQIRIVEKITEGETWPPLLQQGKRLLDILKSKPDCKEYGMDSVA